MVNRRYPYSAELQRLQGEIRTLLPKLEEEKGEGRAVFHIANGAIAARTLPKARFAVKAINHWVEKKEVLQEAIPAPDPSAQYHGPLVQVFKGRGHSSRAPKAGRAKKLEQDGIGLGTISR